MLTSFDVDLRLLRDPVEGDLGVGILLVERVFVEEIPGLEDDDDECAYLGAHRGLCWRT